MLKVASMVCSSPGASVTVSLASTKAMLAIRLMSLRAESLQMNHPQRRSRIERAKQVELRVTPVLPAFRPLPPKRMLKGHFGAKDRQRLGLATILPRPKRYPDLRSRIVSIISLAFS